MNEIYTLEGKYPNLKEEFISLLRKHNVSNFDKYNLGINMIVCSIMTFEGDIDSNINKALINIKGLCYESIDLLNKLNGEDNV